MTYPRPPVIFLKILPKAKILKTRPQNSRDLHVSFGKNAKTGWLAGPSRTQILALCAVLKNFAKQNFKNSAQRQNLCSGGASQPQNFKILVNFYQEFWNKKFQNFSKILEFSRNLGVWAFGGLGPFLGSGFSKVCIPLMKIFDFHKS